jgi:membrane protein
MNDQPSSSSIKRRTPVTLTTIRDQLVLSLVAGLTGHKSRRNRHHRSHRNKHLARFDPQPGKRGRDADTPSQIPAKGWKDIAWRVYEGMQKDRVLLIAAGVTFYSLLAAFPAVAAAVALYGLMADPHTINQQLALLAGIIPDGAVQVIGDQVNRLLEQGTKTLGFALIAGLAVSLWGANAATKAVFDALNVIYHEDEKRSFLKLNLYSLAFTLGAILVLLLAAGSVVVVPALLAALGIESLLALLRWPVLLAAILVALACLYRFGPSRARAEWRWVTWGSALAALLWLAASMSFSWYVANFGSYNATYGSLGAAIGFMTWMWLSTIVVLLGAKVNAELEHQTAKDTTQGADKPMGTRGAEMADSVGQARAG